MSESEAFVFNSKFIKASRAKHQCMGCKLEIPVGYCYVSYPAVTEKGKFCNMNLCVCCAYLWKQKTGEYQEYLKEGEFSDRKIPNFLRKKRDHFEENPEKVFREEGIMFFGKRENPVKELVVSAEEFQRRFLYVRASRYKASQFMPGADITLCAGVNGSRKNVRMVKTACISGKSIGKRGNFIAVLVR